MTTAFDEPWRQLLREPLWRERDLGVPLPRSEHAVSVCLPLWRHVIAYEEQDAAVVDRLQCGYPRFLHPSATVELTKRALERFGKTGEAAMVFPSEAVALRAVAYLAGKEIHGTRVVPWGFAGLHVVAFAAAGARAARDFWRYGGEGVSSRLAIRALEDKSARPMPTASEVEELRRRVCARIAEHAGVEAGDVYLFPSGMAAVSTAQRMIQECVRSAPTVQMDLPYVDVLRVQREFGRGGSVLDSSLPLDAPGGLAERLSQPGGLAAVYFEVPANPMLDVPPLSKTAALARAHGACVVVDDTLATSVNAHVAPHADLITTSLTKAFSGGGEVMAGSLCVTTGSPHREVFREWLKRNHEPGILWCEDLVELESSSRDYADRARRTTEGTVRIVNALAGHPAIARLRYPGWDGALRDESLLRSGAAGWGMVFSLVLRGGEPVAERFYDTLEVSKGPSLGTNFSLASPYVLLAHYDELPWVESQGAPRHLVRFSVGLEDPDDLVERLRSALRHAEAG